MPTSRTANHALRTGSIFGAIIAVVTLIDVVIQGGTGSFIFPGDVFSTAFALIDFQSAGVAGIASGVQLLTLLVLTFVVGRDVARQTGRVGSGVATGLIAGTVGTLIGFVVGIIVAMWLFSPGQPLQTGSAAFQLADIGGLLFDTAFSLITFAPFYVGFGAGCAALGGEFGARAYRKAHPTADLPPGAGWQQPPPAVPSLAIGVMPTQEAEGALIRPSLRNGLIFGAILAAGLLVGTIVQERTGALTSPEDLLFAAFQLIGFLSAGVVVYIELLGLLVLTFVAGIRAARQSGKLGSGVLAGLFAGAVGGLVGYAIGSVVIVWLLPLVAPLPQQQAGQGQDIGLLIASSLIGAEYVVPIWAMLGGALGLLGGLIGANNFRKAQPIAAPTSVLYASYPPYPSTLAYPPYPGMPSYPPYSSYPPPSYGAFGDPGIPQMQQSPYPAPPRMPTDGTPPVEPQE